MTSEESVEESVLIGWCSWRQSSSRPFVVIQWKRREKRRRRCGSVALAFLLELYSSELGSTRKRPVYITQPASVAQEEVSWNCLTVASEGQEALMGQLSADAILWPRLPSCDIQDAVCIVPSTEVYNTFLKTANEEVTASRTTQASDNWLVFGNRRVQHRRRRRTAQHHHYGRDEAKYSQHYLVLSVAQGAAPEASGGGS